MPTRTARTAWNGTLEQGSGQVELTSSGVGTYEVSFPKRAADDAGGTTSPEELIAAAHSACYAMQFSALIAQEGGTPQGILVPKGAPKEVGDLLYRETVRVIALPEIREKLAAIDKERGIVF